MFNRIRFRATLWLVVACSVFVSNITGGNARGPMSFAPLASGLQEAVVNISTTRVVTSAPGQGEPFSGVPPGSPFHEFYEHFQDQSPDSGEDNRFEARSLGSGFVIDPGGVIVTNYHVIEYASEIFVTFADGSRFEARVAGADPRTDLAVLRVEAGRDLEFVELGDSDSTLVGDWVLAIGNPFGLGGSLSAGIVSARNRDIHAGPYDNFIQTDAAINQGNSGGPLFNMDGEVVGINTAIYSRTGGSLGIGFSIPINLARPVISQLMQFGETRRGWLGVQVQQVSDDIASGLGRMDRAGALVTGVDEAGPSNGLLLEGDLILVFDGKPITRMRDLPRFVAESDIGKEVVVRVFRLGEEVDLDVTLGRLEDALHVADVVLPPEIPTRDNPPLGLTLKRMTAETRGRFSIDPDVDGVVVVEVAAGTDSDDKDIRPGDTIIEVNQREVTSPDDVDAAVGAAIERGLDVVLLKLADPDGTVRFAGIRTGK